MAAQQEADRRAAADEKQREEHLRSAAPRPPQRRLYDAFDPSAYLSSSGSISAALPASPASAPAPAPPATMFHPIFRGSLAHSHKFDHAWYAREFSKPSSHPLPTSSAISGKASSPIFIVS